MALIALVVKRRKPCWRCGNNGRLGSERECGWCRGLSTEVEHCLAVHRHTSSTFHWQNFALPNLRHGDPLYDLRKMGIGLWMTKTASWSSNWKPPPHPF